MEMRAIFSNRVERLYEELKGRLFPKDHPFLRRMVVVPSPAMKSWLMCRLAKDPEVGIAAGLEVLYLDESIDRLLLQEGVRLPVPRSTEVSFAIEEKIGSHLASGKGLVWEELHRYLDLNTPKGVKRLAALSDKLSALFLEYGIYGGKMIEEWMINPETHWQSSLWTSLFSEKNSPYGAAHFILSQNARWKPLPIHVHLFALSYLPPLYYKFLRQIALAIPVYDYVFSPCSEFWGDLLTDRHHYRQQQRRQKKGASKEQQLEFQMYHEENHPLLANMGQLGRERMQLIEEEDLPTEECYESHSSSKTILTAIQSEILHMGFHVEEVDGNLIEDIPSIQLHVAPTKMREVEGLYHQLLRIIDRHHQAGDPIYPHDILVMSPDINSDAPLIKSVFERQESLLDCQIMDMTMLSEYNSVQAFIQLLTLSDKRWEAPTLMEFFENPSVKMDPTPWREWIELGNIRWGYDIDHRKTILKKEGCLEAPLDTIGTGTWRKGIHKLLQQFIVSQKRQATKKLSLTDAEELGDAIAFLHSLYEDLTPIATNEKMTLGHWLVYLNCLVETYLIDEGNVIAQALQSLGSVSQKIQETSVPFSSVMIRLEKIFEKQRVCYREGHLDAVRFCAFLPMRAIPARIVVLMGMDEGAFPRKEGANALDLLQKGEKPSQRDYDRFLFLESLLSARDYFLMSYVAYAQDGKGQEPSLLIHELIKEIEKKYTINGKPFSQTCIVNHPFYPFDPRCFAADELQSYSQIDFQTARIYTHQEVKLSPALTLMKPSTKSLKMPSVITLKQILLMARNPIQAYCNQTLGIYLPRSDKEQMEDEDLFVLSPIERARSKQSALQNAPFSPSEELYQSPLARISQETLAHELEQFKHNLNKISGDPETYKKITFSTEFLKANQDKEGNWNLPPLTVKFEGNEVLITGKFEAVSENGLVTWHGNTAPEVVKGWPQYLLYSLLHKEHQLPFENQWILGKSLKVKASYTVDPLSELEKYIRYYHSALDHLSPLLPEWVSEFVEKDTEKLKKLIDRSLTSTLTPFYNNYMLWLARSGHLPNWDFNRWEEDATLLYSKMLTSWFSTKEKGEEK